MKKTFLQLPILLPLFIFVGCAKKSTKGLHKVDNVPSVSSYSAMLRPFKARVDGVECALCADDVKRMMQEIDGIDFIDFVLSGTDYEKGYLSFCYDIGQSNFDIMQLDNLLMKEGFQLSSLSGAFAVQVLSREGLTYAVLQSDFMVPIQQSVGRAAELSSNQTALCLVQGSVVKDLESGTFSLLI